MSEMTQHIATTKKDNTLSKSQHTEAMSVLTRMKPVITDSEASFSGQIVSPKFDKYDTIPSIEVNRSNRRVYQLPINLNKNVRVLHHMGDDSPTITLRGSQNKQQRLE